MAIEPKDFEYVYNNFNRIIDEVAIIPKNKRTPRQDELFSEALLMDKLVYESRYE